MIDEMAMKVEKREATGLRERVCVSFVSSHLMITSPLKLSSYPSLHLTPFGSRFFIVIVIAN